MQKLQECLKDATEYLKTVFETQQQQYSHHHKLRSKDTIISVWDEVVVLIPDFTEKLCSKWKGNICTKIDAVKLSYESIQHLHQNKLRKYIQPIRTIGDIYEVDEKFGEVEHALVEHSR